MNIVHFGREDIKFFRPRVSNNKASTRQPILDFITTSHKDHISGTGRQYVQAYCFLADRVERCRAACIDSKENFGVQWRIIKYTCTTGGKSSVLQSLHNTILELAIALGPFKISKGSLICWESVPRTQTVYHNFVLQPCSSRRGVIQ